MEQFGNALFIDSELQASEKDEKKRASSIQGLDPDVFICGWSRYDIDHFVTNKTLVGMIYHGIGVKPSYWRDNHERLDLRFVEGPYRMDQLRSHGIETDLVLTGFIKLDHYSMVLESTMRQ